MALVIPKLRLAVLCSHIEFDGKGLPFQLQEPLHTIQPEAGNTFPFEIPSFYLYAQLEDALGSCRFKVVTRDEDGIEGNRTSQMELNFDGVLHRFIPREMTFELRQFRFPRPGIYSFHIICNHASLSDARDSEPHPYPAPRLHVLSGGAI